MLDNSFEEKLLDTWLLIYIGSLFLILVMDQHNLQLYSERGHNEPVLVAKDKEEFSDSAFPLLGISGMK